MTSKRCLSFFLIFSLLVLPVTRSYGFSWEQWRMAPINSITHYFDKETAQKLFPIAILAGLVALYYWMNKKSGGAGKSKLDESGSSKSEDDLFDFGNIFVGKC